MRATVEGLSGEVRAMLKPQSLGAQASHGPAPGRLVRPVAGKLES